MNISNICRIIHDKWVDADETVQGRTAQCAIILIVLGALAYIGLTIAASKHLEIDWSNRTVDLCVGSAGALLLGAMLYRIYSTPVLLTEFVPQYDRHSEDSERSWNSACQGDQSLTASAKLKAKQRTLRRQIVNPAENQQPAQVHLVIQDRPAQKTVAVDAQPQGAALAFEEARDEARLEHAQTRELRHSQLEALSEESRRIVEEFGNGQRAINNLHADPWAYYEGRADGLGFASPNLPSCKNHMRSEIL